jgi:hypothetical protein
VPALRRAHGVDTATVFGPEKHAAFYRTARHTQAFNAIVEAQQIPPPKPGARKPQMPADVVLFHRRHLDIVLARAGAALAATGALEAQWMIQVIHRVRPPPDYCQCAMELA